MKTPSQELMPCSFFVIASWPGRDEECWRGDVQDACVYDESNTKNGTIASSFFSFSAVPDDMTSSQIDLRLKM